MSATTTVVAVTVVASVAVASVVRTAVLFGFLGNDEEEEEEEWAAAEEEEAVAVGVGTVCGAMVLVLFFPTRLRILVVAAVVAVTEKISESRKVKRKLH
mmetsp:Transcript_10686/g.19722  ORF Transcript_10686/g.19722 Transcript_10686/m.19722 type:complete len:99 (-) Transcript_10686:154-450(-)